MTREILGRVVCPECGWEHAEIKLTKAGLAYRWCPDCEAQYFARTPETSERLLAKVGRGKDAPAPAGAAVKPTPAAKPKPDLNPLPEAKAPRKPTYLDILGVKI